MNLLSPTRWLRISVVATLSSLVCICAIAQDPAWLKKNHFPNPNRYEGLLDQPNASREYDVLSFLAVATPKPAKLPEDRPVELRLQFCRPTQSIGGTPTREPAYIEVRQLTGHVNYLMKAAEDTPAPTSKSGLSTFDWPTNDVIRRNNINPNNLGVVIHLGQDNEYAGSIAPAVFATTANPLSSSVDHYDLILRIQQTSLDNLAYQIRPAAGPAIQCFYLNDFHPCETEPPVHQPVIEQGSIVDLRFTLSSSQQGPVVLHIQGDHHNSDEKLDANFRFVHQLECR